MVRTGVKTPNIENGLLFGSSLVTSRSSAAPATSPCASFSRPSITATATASSPMGPGSSACPAPGSTTPATAPWTRDPLSSTFRPRSWTRRWHRALLGRLHHVTLDVDNGAAWHGLHDRLKDGARRRRRHPGVLPRRARPVRPDLPGAPPPRPGDHRSRVVLEKPLGTGPRERQPINEAVGPVFDEPQIFRIDHYLGKESVQNLLVTRFANAFLEPMWNSHWVDHVQITASETLGAGTAAATTTAPARCATWCRTTCCSCSASSRWSRPTATRDRP